jgi:hypothetical protein
MARSKGLIKLEGTLGGLTFVNSKRYRDHVRTARGTHKEAKVNTVLQANSDNAKEVTFVASPVLKELKAIERGFASGDLWSRMMGAMLKTRSTAVADLLACIQGMELNDGYSFAKVFPSLPVLTFSFQKNVLLLEMQLLSHARFSKDTRADCYFCEMRVLFLDGNGNCVEAVIETDWISFDEALGTYEMEFEKPRGAKYFLVVAGVKGGRDEKLIERFAARGYRISGCGKF